MVATTGEEASTKERQRPFERMMQHLRETKATVHTRLFGPTSLRRQTGVSQVRWHRHQQGDWGNLQVAERSQCVPEPAGGVGPGHYPEAPAGKQPVSCDLRATGWRV